VEAILDASHALEDHVTWLPSMPTESDKEVRDAAMEQLRVLRARINDEGSRSAITKEMLEKEAAELQGRLMRFPLFPTQDVLGFLMDPANTPKLPPEAHMLISIVRDQGLYFQPQGRTKFMNEGWASYWEKHLLLQPELSFPIEFRMSLAKYWTMHSRQATNWYFDPYALGLNVFEYIDEKYGYDEAETDMEVKPLVMVNDNVVVEAEETRVVKFTPRNRDKMLQVRKHYDDNRFLEEFLNEELFEKINLRALEWVRRLMTQISNLLRKQGWNPQLVADPLPLTLEGLMGVVELWMNTAETSQQLHAQAGAPMFPVPPQILQEMGTVLQIVGAFDANPHKARRQLVLRTAYHSKPSIWVVDTGRRSDGVWTLKHEFDENFGPLMQSEARDTLKYFRRLCCEPARLVTMEQRMDRNGRPSGPPVPYEYFTEDGINVKERFL
jgi:spore cortex formation protein SpoVR/YcgB (stage V sporulation)